MRPPRDGPLTRYELKSAKVTTEHDGELAGDSRKEGPQNLLSNCKNKWYVPNHSKAWVIVDFGSQLDFTAIGLKGAGDN